jgi:hypothetical protein
VKFHVREVYAVCQCGGREFEPVGPGERGAGAMFVCTACGRRVRRFDLLMQISEEVVRRSRDYLDALRARRASSGQKDKS